MLEELASSPSQVAAVLVLLVAAGITCRGLAHVMGSKQSNPYARLTMKGGSSRRPPDPRFFPHTMQNRQGLWLHWREWWPAAYATSPSDFRAPQGVLFIVHGLGDHAALWEHVARRFAKECSLAVFLLEHQGHGSSEGDRLFVERFDDLVADTEQFMRERIAAQPTLAALPRFALGQSLGGLITATLAARLPPGYFSGGVILQCPALTIDPRVTPPFAVSLAGLLSRYVPKLRLPGKFDVSRNQQTIDQLKVDFLVVCNPTVRLGAEALKAMSDLQHVIVPRMDALAFRLLVQHGTADKVIPIDGSRRYVAAVPLKSKELREYPGMEHDLRTDEECSELVMHDVFRFVECATKSTTP